MAYTRKDFGLELKKRIIAKQRVKLIAGWAFGQYLAHQFEIDDDFQNFLKDLSAMRQGVEFEFSYEELDQIADRLIAGENVKLYESVENSESMLKNEYTRKDFGLALKEKIKNKEDQELIGRWVLNMYYDYMLEIDDDFKDFLTDLSGMSAGPEFVRSYEELDQIADKLIAGENVKLYP